MGITLPAPEIYSLSETHLHFLVPTRRDRTNCGICHVNGGTKALVIIFFFFSERSFVVVALCCVHYLKAARVTCVAAKFEMLLSRVQL